MQDLDRTVCSCACHADGNERHSDCCVIATLRARLAEVERERDEARGYLAKTGPQLNRVIEEKKVALTRVAVLEAFVQDFADEPCAYGDGCPAFGTRHGTCNPCRARLTLAAPDAKEDV